MMHLMLLYVLYNLTILINLKLEKKKKKKKHTQKKTKKKNDKMIDATDVSAFINQDHLQF